MIVYDLGLLDGRAVFFCTHFKQYFGHGTSFGCVLVVATWVCWMCMRWCLVHTSNIALVVVYFLDVNWVRVSCYIHSILEILLPSCNILWLYIYIYLLG